MSATSHSFDDRLTSAVRGFMRAVVATLQHPDLSVTAQPLPTEQETIMNESYVPEVPGQNGTVGPWRSQYGRPHVYARDIHSGAGNCVCAAPLGDRLHTEAAPGVPVPDRMRS